MSQTFSLFLGRQNTINDLSSRTEVWAVNPGLVLLGPSLFFGREEKAVRSFFYRQSTKGRYQLAATLLYLSGVPKDVCDRMADQLARQVVQFLRCPWGIKAKHLREWTENPLLPVVADYGEGMIWYG